MSRSERTQPHSGLLSRGVMRFPRPSARPGDLTGRSDLALPGMGGTSHMEAYELAAEADIARFDLSLYGEDATQKLKSWEAIGFNMENG